jgi:DNA-binding transcriptional LysR family regulator
VRAIFGAELNQTEGGRMRLVTKRGVLQSEHREARALADWDNARIFLEVVRRGSFRSAADRLRQSINAVRRHVDEFEREIGTRLFTRDVHGTRLTEEAVQIVEAVERMEAATFDVLRSRNLISPAISGEVRVAVTEGLGTFWLAPRLVEFQRSYPSVVVDLHCEMRSADVLRHEADVAIQLTKPTTLDMKVVKLGRLHVMWYASQKYINDYGKPSTYEELIKHRIVMQFADQTAANEIFDAWFPGLKQQELLVMRNNVSSANFWAIAKGAGIGLLPTYASALGTDVVPLGIGNMHRPFDIWLTYHPDVSRIPRVRKLIDWLIKAFDPRKFPWFRDEFIAPNELMRQYEGEPLSNMFAGFLRSGTNQTTQV